jgi:[ribosomal protein S5]-alanine N-acetyltransferase
VFGLFKPSGPTLSGNKTILKLPLIADYAAWKSLRVESRNELTPFEPRWPQHELTRSAFIARVRQANILAAGGEAFQFLIFNKDCLDLLGGITLGNIRRGAAQTGEIGYWLGTKYCGQGSMHDAVATVLNFAFLNLRLHRVEAACIQINVRSIALLQHCGFHYEGSARNYLEIDGRRQDHHLYACLPHDVSTDQ